MAVYELKPASCSGGRSHDKAVDQFNMYKLITFSNGGDDLPENFNGTLEYEDQILFVSFYEDSERPGLYYYRIDDGRDSQAANPL